MGLVLFLPEAMHRVGTRVFVRSAYHNSSKHPDIDFAFCQRHILFDRNQTVRVRNWRDQTRALKRGICDPVHQFNRKIAALALVSDLVFGTEPSWQDPATYSFAHGGKDGYPYPVDRGT